MNKTLVLLMLRFDGTATTTATVVFDTSVYTVLTSYADTAAAGIIIGTIKGCVI